MAPRGRGSRRGSSRSEESRPPGPSSPPPPASPPPRTEEQELDERLAALEATARLQRKRRRIEALERGEDPDEPADSERRSASPRRHKSDAWSKLQLPALRYKGQSWGELNSFLHKLEGRFELHREDLRTDIQRVVYASSALEGPIEKRWTSLVQTTYGGQVGMVSWEDMKSWLRNGISDESTRTLEAASKLVELRQREDQKFNSFLDIYEATETELPYTLPEMHRAVSLLNQLRPTLRTQIINQGVPKNREELISSARRAEAMLPTPISSSQDTASRGRGNASVPPNSFRNPSFPPTRTPAPASSSVAGDTPSQPFSHMTGGHTTSVDPRATPTPGGVPLGQSPQADSYRARVTCFGCGETGHIVSRCPHARCRKCNQLGHHASNCPEAATGSNREPAVKQQEVQQGQNG